MFDATVRTVSRGRDSQRGDGIYTSVRREEELEDCEQCGDGDCGFSTVQREKWVHVGRGQGSYSKTKNMLFVGDRHGNYEREQVVHQRYSWFSPGGIFFIGLGMLAIMLLGYSLGLLLKHFMEPVPRSLDAEPELPVLRARTRSFPPIPEPKIQVDRKRSEDKPEVPDVEKERPRYTGKFPFDCSLEKDGWDQNWSDAKKDYCCSTEHFGCSEERFDCQLQRNDFQKKWTPQKSAYCCDKYGFGCDHAAAGCDRSCTIFGQTASCRDRAYQAFNKVGSCAKAHEEVLKLCWVCDVCPAKGLKCSKMEEQEREAEKRRKAEQRKKEEKQRKKEEEERRRETRKEEEERRKEEEENKKERKELASAWKVNRVELPCEHPAEEGYRWTFNTSKSVNEWQQQPIQHGVHSTPAGRGFMWRKEGYSWKQVCIPHPAAAHLPAVPVGAGFMWHRHFDAKGAIWEQRPLVLRSAGKAGYIPESSAGPGLLWQKDGAGWRQVLLPSDMRQPERPCDRRAGPGMRWFFRAARGDVWQQLPIPGWTSDSVNPQPGVAAGKGFMWSYEPQDHGWTQICIPGWSPDEPRPPKLEAGSGFMWLKKDGSWTQMPVPRGVRTNCSQQPTLSFAPAGRGFMWKCTKEHGLLAWHQVHRNSWHEDGATSPPKEPPGHGLMWIFKDGYWQQQLIPGWRSAQAPSVSAGPGLMWKRVDLAGEKMWQQEFIPDWEADSKLHPPGEPAGEGMMWRYDSGLKEWSQQRIGDWYADSANHPPTEYAGDGLMWDFVTGGTPGEWQQVEIPDWHVLGQFEQPTKPVGPGFMWSFDQEIGRWKQLPIPKWSEARREDQPPRLPAGQGYMWKFYKENGQSHWHQVELSKSQLLRHAEPREPAGTGFRWQYITEGDRDHWEQVLTDRPGCTGVLCSLRFW